MKSINIILVLASLLYPTTAAFPSGQAFLATFDTLPQVDSGGTAHVPTPYVNLGWNNIHVASPDNSVLVTPHSALAGALGALPSDPTSNITVHYPGSRIKAFDLISTWVACATFNDYPPEKCVVRFAGYKAHKEQHNGTARSVSYDCAFSGGDVMEFCTLPRSFRRLATVDVVIAVNGSDLGQVVQLDDVKGIVYR